MRSLVLPFLLLAACTPKPTPTYPVARHSSSLALSPDGKRLFAVNTDSDSVSLINVATRSLEKEILLGAAPPTVDAAGRFTPAVAPRALALASHANRLYITGERSGLLYTVDLSSFAIVRQTPLCAEPIGVLVSPDETAVYATCSNEERVVRVDASSGEVTQTVVPAKPWALAWSADSKTLFVAHLLGAGLSSLDPETMKLKTTVTLPDVAPRSNILYPNGTARSLYDVTPRPGTKELWIPHTLLSTTTAQPDLAFNTSVFSALAVIGEDGKIGARYTEDVLSIAGVDGAFGDIVSGPRALEFTPDGHFGLMVDSGSEDILLVDAVKGTSSSVLRHLPGHLPDGIVLSADGKTAYVNERNSGDIAVVSVGATLERDGPVIPKYATDPMPAPLRRGQQLFYSANSDRDPDATTFEQFSITRDDWVSCSSCHPEGRSDGVTWRFLSGPRDTPSNAGGQRDTGFLLHTGDRRTVQDYWHTIEAEQGGSFKPTTDGVPAALDALAAFVNDGIPVPVPPKTNPSLVEQGRGIFQRPDVGCASCHYGPALTDSGANNPTLDLAGPILLHDVGTCDTSSAYPDLAHTDDDGHARAACQFDTPALRGLADSAPYFHDGRAATLRDTLEMTRGKMGNINVLSADEESALIEYLRSL
jgi:YVTN family beta-propeller protein